MGNNNHAMKKNILIFIPIVLLPFVILLFFDTRLWLTARDLLPPDYYFIPQLVTNWGLYLFYAVFAALFVYSFAKKKPQTDPIVSGLPQSPAYCFVCAGQNFKDCSRPGPATALNSPYFR